MSDLEKNQHLLSEIGRKLWSIMPPEASEIYYVAYFHQNMTSGGVTEWLNKDGSLGLYTPRLQRPYELDEEIRLLTEDLKSSEVFTKLPWTHVKFTLNDQAKMTTDFAYVHDEDAHPNLHMKGIPDLDRKEAYDQYGVSYEDWVIIARRAAARKRQEAEQSDVAGDFDLRDLLRTQVANIEKRLIDAGR